MLVVRVVLEVVLVYVVGEGGGWEEWKESCAARGEEGVRSTSIAGG